VSARTLSLTVGILPKFYQSPGDVTGAEEVEHSLVKGPGTAAGSLFEFFSPRRNGLIFLAVVRHQNLAPEALLKNLGKRAADRHHRLAVRPPARLLGPDSTR